jgi:hypothetical protein
LMVKVTKALLGKIPNQVIIISDWVAIADMQNADKLNSEYRKYNA